MPDEWQQYAVTVVSNATLRRTYRIDARSPDEARALLRTEHYAVQTLPELEQMVDVQESFVEVKRIKPGSVIGRVDP